MKTINHILRTSALPAIAAALALSSTSALAQQAQPVPADPPTATAPTDQAAPAPTAEPTASDTSTAPASDATVTSTTAKTAATTSVPKSTKRVARTTHVAAKTSVAKPAAVTHVASRSVTTHAAVPAAAAAPAPAPAPSVQTSQSAVKPLVALNANPAPKTSAPAKPAKKHSDTLPIAGGALAFLAIGGAAVALTRRRHDDEEEWVEEDSAESAENIPLEEPVVHQEEPPMIAPAASAFAWGDRQPTQEMERRSETAEDDDRLPGETWIQRAYRGPTANNPSVSLRARLKRAAFFDKRERDVAAGTAEPVEMDAGLPEAMIEEQERELA